MFGFLVNFLTRVFGNRKKRSDERKFREFIDNFKKECEFDNADFIDTLEAAHDQQRGINSTSVL